MRRADRQAPAAPGPIVSALAPEPEEVTLDVLAETTGERVLRGGLWSALAKVLPQGYVLMQSAVAARYLGVEGMGRQSFIAFVQLSVVLLFGFGLNGALVRYFAESLGQRRPEAARGMVDWVWRIEAVAAAAAAGLFTIIGLASEDLTAPWVLAGIGCALGVLNHVPYAVLSGSQRWRQFSTISLAIGGTGMVATVGVLAAGGGIPGIFATQAVVAAASLAWTGSLTRRTLASVAPRPGPFEDLRGPMVRFALVNLVGFALSLILWRRSEFFFLKRYSTDAEIGLYSVAFAAVAALVGALEAISAVMAPAVATLSGAGATARIRDGVGRACRLVLVLSLPMTAGALAVGPAALHLVYGSDYRGAGGPLVLMLAVFPLLPLMNLASATLWGLGRVRVWLLLCAAASVANLVMGLVLIPPLGAAGAALANSGAQLVAAVAIVAYASRALGGVDWHPRGLGGTLVASALCGAAARSVVGVIGGVLGLAAAMAVGVGVLVAAGGWLGMLAPDDARWLDRSFGAHLGGLVGRLVRRIGLREPDRPAGPAAAGGPAVHPRGGARSRS